MLHPYMLKAKIYCFIPNVYVFMYFKKCEKGEQVYIYRLYYIYLIFNCFSIKIFIVAKNT